MGKSLYIAEKPSVAQEFAKALKINGQRKDGYLESEDSVVTWCVGHLVTMSYPEKYDIKYKRWSLDTLPLSLIHIWAQKTEGQSLSVRLFLCRRGCG